MKMIRVKDIIGTDEAWTFEQAEAVAAAVLAAGPDAQVSFAGMRLFDQGFVNRLYERFAEANGVDPAGRFYLDDLPQEPSRRWLRHDIDFARWRVEKPEELAELVQAIDDEINDPNGY